VADESKIRPPRGALIVIAVGLLATVMAALLANENLAGSVATLEWVEKAPLPDSKKAAIPGGGQMQLTEGEIRATEPNIGEYTLFRSSALLTISRGAAVGQARLRCSIRVSKRTIPAKTPKSRASYPRSSEELSEQETSETAAVEFSSHSTDLAAVEMADIIGKRYTRQKGVVVEWAPFRIGQQVWKYGLPAGRPGEDLTLPFASIWRTTAQPAAQVACTVENSGGTATVSTAGKLES
jgi:hypothetical protein